jgi:hypothetical protein
LFLQSYGIDCGEKDKRSMKWILTVQVVVVSLGDFVDRAFLGSASGRKDIVSHCCKSGMCLLKVQEKSFQRMIGDVDALAIVGVTVTADLN